MCFGSIHYNGVTIGPKLYTCTCGMYHCTRWSWLLSPLLCLFICVCRALHEVSDTPDPSLSARAADENDEGDGNEDRSHHPHMELFTWAPKGNALAFVYKSNIYYKPNALSDKIYPITSDGQPQVLFNGIPDWVYEGTLTECP